MKKTRTLIVLSLLCGSFSANAAEVSTPTLYGRVNKEVHYINQDDKFGRTKWNGVTDVQNTETRLGVKGELPVSETMKAWYVIELGLDSSYSDSTSKSSPRIRLRHAKVELGDTWGTVLMGLTATAMGESFSGYDPLSHTSAALLGADQKSYIAGVVSNLGYYDRVRKNLLGYRSPIIAGLQYFTTLDRNDSSILLDATPRPINFWEHNLSYSMTQESMSLNVNGGLIKTMGGSTLGEETDLYGGARVTYSGFAVASRYTAKTVETNVDAKDHWVMGSLSYTTGIHTLATTVGNHAIDNGNGADTGKKTNTQYAFGYVNKLSKNLTLSGTFSITTVSEDNPALAAANDNSARSFAFGTQITF